MKMRFCVAILLVTASSQVFSENRFEVGAGLEWDGAFTKNLEFQPEPGNPTHFSVKQKGEASYSDADYRVSISLGYRVLDKSWVGLRASQGTSMSRSNFASFFFPIPRANLILKQDLTDWFSIGIEFPYNPGIVIQFFSSHYLYAGTDDIPNSPSRNPSHLSLAYLYNWRLE